MLDAMQKSLPQQGPHCQPPAHTLLAAPWLSAAALPARGHAHLAQASSEGSANLWSWGDRYWAIDNSSCDLLVIIQRH